METPSKVVEISPARGRDERSLKWIAMTCVIVYLVSLGSIFGMAMMAIDASKETHVSESGVLVSADTGKPVAVDPIANPKIYFGLYELASYPIDVLALLGSLEFKYVDANNVITPAFYQIVGVRKTAEGRATLLTAVGDTITVDGSNKAAFLESDGVSYTIIWDDGRKATDKATMNQKWTWGDDNDNRQPGSIGTVPYDLKPAPRDLRESQPGPIGTVKYDLKSPPRNSITISRNPFGANKADERIYGSSRYTGSYPGVIGARNEDLH